MLLKVVGFILAFHTAHFIHRSTDPAPIVITVEALPAPVMIFVAGGQLRSRNGRNRVKLHPGALHNDCTDQWINMRTDRRTADSPRQSNEEANRDVDTSRQQSCPSSRSRNPRLY
jgi:hypothetical protein